MRIALLTLAVVVGSIVPARADTIVIRSGFLGWEAFASGSGFTRLTLEGTRGYSSESRILSGVFQPQECLFAFCFPGDPVGVGAHWVGLDLPSTVHLGGQTYDAAAGPTAPVFSLGVEFAGASVIPPNPGAGPLIVPFTFTGLFLAGPDGVFNLHGGGLASLWFAQGFQPGTWFVQRLEYNFVDPIPEPATVLLVGGGLAVAALRRRRRSRQ